MRSTTIENLSAEIVDAVTAGIQDSKLNLATTVAGILRERLPAVHPSLKQCCGCHAIWTTDKYFPHNTCPACGGQCGGLRIIP